MLTPLPLLAFALFWLCAYRRTGQSYRDGRHAFLVASLAWGVVTTAIMEGFSLTSALAPPAVAGAWIVAALAAAAATPWRTGRPALGIAAVAAPWRLGRPVFGGATPRERAIAAVRLPREWGVVAATGAVLAGAGLLAVAGGISTNDAVDYHLPRVMHWIQNGSVAFYPTAVSRQLNLGPWAEYAIAQFLILGGGDAWANLVQWFAFGGSAVGVSLIARELGAGPRGQLYAAVFAATIPMAVLQASTAQNDLVEAFWVVALVYADPAAPQRHHRGHAPSGHGSARPAC